eukprot:2018510-Pleurochrysis_carterae.AAC.1
MPRRGPEQPCEENLESTSTGRQILPRYTRTRSLFRPPSCLAAGQRPCSRQKTRWQASTLTSKISCCHAPPGTPSEGCRFPFSTTSLISRLPKHGCIRVERTAATIHREWRLRREADWAGHAHAPLGDAPRLRGSRPGSAVASSPTRRREVADAAAQGIDELFIVDF